MIEILKFAVAAFTKGEIGEREFIAICLAVNDALPDTVENATAREAYGVFARQAKRQLMDRVAELDAGRP